MLLRRQREEVRFSVELELVADLCRVLGQPRHAKERRGQLEGWEGEWLGGGGRLGPTNEETSDARVLTDQLRSGHAHG